MYTTQRKGTTASKAMPLEAYVVDWLKPGHPPATPSRRYHAQGGQQTVSTPQSCKPSIIADGIGNGGR